MDFTLGKYEELCKSISGSNYKNFTIENFLKNKKQTNFIILRHDVDRSPENALKIAQIEGKYGLKSTFYFRMKTFDEEIMKKIREIGHEIGYHYECLDEARGDPEKAIRIFEENLKKFSQFNTKTICMHGNPLSGWVNKDMWKIRSYRDFGIIGEAYLSFNFKKVRYFTDTGRRWNSEKYSVKDLTDSSLMSIKSTDELISKVRNTEMDNLYLLVHPCRWNDSIFAWLKELILQNLKNIGKGMLKKSR